jgi:hypothetical protein
VSGGEHRHAQFLGDLPPAGIGDRSEVEPAAEPRQLGRQADYFGEVPQVLLEHRTVGRFRQRETGLAADVDAGEHRPQRRGDLM